MNALRQVFAVTVMGLEAIPQRLGASLVVIIGMASVVAVTISILSMSTGLLTTIKGSGRADRAVVLSRGARFDFASHIPRDSALTIADAPGVKHTQDGKPISAVQSLASVAAQKKANGLDVFIPLQGASPEFFVLHPEVRVTSGRLFRPATHELIVGKSAQGQFRQLNIGDKVSLSSDDWTVTGVFDSGGGVFDSVLIADSETLLSALRTNAFNTVTVMLDRADAFDRFKNALTSNPTLGVDVWREPEFLANQWKQLSSFLSIIAYVIGGIMGLGAVFAAMNTMYSAVSSRTVEIATLRAIGFGAGAVVTSVFVEALLLALLGAVIGAALAWVVFNGNLHAAGSMVFTLTVTPALIGSGIAFACVLGLIGGLFPAIRAALLPVATALRTT